MHMHIYIYIYNMHTFKVVDFIVDHLIRMAKKNYKVAQVIALRTR